MEDGDTLMLFFLGGGGEKNKIYKHKTDHNKCKCPINKNQNYENKYNANLFLNYICESYFIETI